jgi:hypothetical protein
VLLAGGRRVGNFIQPAVESHLLDSLAVTWVQAVDVDCVAQQSFLLGHWVTYVSIGQVDLIFWGVDASGGVERAVRISQRAL